jgi:hypothetical protein
MSKRSRFFSTFPTCRSRNRSLLSAVGPMFSCFWAIVRPSETAFEELASVRPEGTSART